MGSDWNKFFLDQLYEFRSGLSKPRSGFGSGYPFLSFKDVFYNSAVPELKELVNSTDSERRNCSIRRGDVFLTRTSETMEELGMSSVALRDIPNATFNGFTKRLRLKDVEIVIPEYARYYFRSPAFRQEVTAMSSLSTRASLNNEMLGRLSITVPSCDEQKVIGYILGSLDDKIELNRRMNQTLEAMARAIFNSWFVDFDPVRAKAEGRPTGLPDDIAALFPDSFEDSEIGQIPRGWEVKTIGDVAKFAYGKALKASDRKPGDVPVFGSNGQVGLHDKALVKGPGIVIGRKGNPGIVTWSYEDFFPIDTTFYVMITGIIPSLNYLFYALKTQNLPSLSADSAVPGLNRNLAYMSKFLVPQEKVLPTFDGQIDPLFQKIYANIKESKTLAFLRDTLLPKLISGEVRVPDAEKFVEEAGV